MRRRADVALAATLHDPPGALAAMIRRWLPRLRRLYGAIAVTTTPTTAVSVNALLAAHGVLAGQMRVDSRGPTYRRALRAALASGAEWLQYLDFDRALHWAATRPDELAAVLRLGARHPALVVGRTRAAHRSHQRALVETEGAVNARFAARIGVAGRVDFLVPAFIVRRDLATALLRRSRARDAELYGEWAALLATASAPAALAYVECRGLDWETPDRHAAEVRRIGLGAWRRRLDTPAEWAARRALAHACARGFAAALRGRRVHVTLRRLRLPARGDRLPR